MKHTTLARLVLFAALLSFGVACREPAPPPAARAAPPRMSSDAPGAPFALGEVIRRTHFSYREQGDGWSAGHGTWSARVTPGGLTFTPRHALEAAPEGAARAQAAPRVLTGAPITFGAAVVSRGGVPLESTAGRGSVAQDGSLSLARGEVREQLLNGEDGIEQRWHFAREPRGQGAMLLRVPVQGLRFAGETPRGVHFADATGLGVRYSHATWTDAAGKQTQVRARGVAGAVEFQVPAALLAGSAFPAMLAPTVSPEFGLDTPVTDPGGGSQTAPAVASSGTDYLVVWTDDRGGDMDIYGARVSQAGAVLDSTGIPIARALNSQQNPAVAFDGTNYFVVWSDGRRGSGVDLYGARVSPAGSVLDPTGRVVANSTVFTLMMDFPAIAFDGTNYLIIWEERLGFSAASNLMGTRVSPTGAPVGSAFVVSNATGNQGAPALAFDGTNYLAVWQDDRSSGQNDIYASRISPAGTVLDVSGIVVSSTPQTQINPTVAFNGTSYLVVWEDYRNLATSADLYGARLTPSGSVLDASGLPLIQAAANQSQPSLARVGTQYLLAWHDLRADNQDVYAARVDEAGSVLDGSGVPVKVAPGNQYAVAVATNGTDSLVTWNDGRSLDIAGARVSAAGAVLDSGGFTISLSPNSETNAAVAFDGTHFLVVWQDNRGSGFDIYGVRVSASGTVLDPSGLAISTATGHQRNPALAYDGTNYLVVWEDTRSSPTSDIYGARVSPSGTVLDLDGVGFCLRFNSQEQPAIAFDGTNYLVVWADSGTSAPRDIYGTRISTAGAVLDPSFIAINANAADQAAPALAFDGSNYLVVWSDWRNSTSDIYGTRVSRTGAVLEANGTQIGGGAEAQTDAAVAFDGTNYLVVWSDYQLFPSSNLFARRVRTAGAPLDVAAITVSAASGNQQQASVVYNGTDFIVAWQDSRSGTDMDIYAGRITRTGVPQDGDGFIVSAGPNAESTVALASAGAQGVLAVYQVTDPSSGSNVQRLKARWLSSSSNTPPTAEPQSGSTEEDQALALELTGSDAEGGALTYTVVDQPQHGTITGLPPKITYTPALNYHGPDSFTFTVSDGQATSAPATVSLTITPVNDAPTATAQSIPTPEETATDITLTAEEPEGELLSFAVASQPAHGTLTGTPPDLTYTPAPDYYGPDSFTFTASDGTTTSAPGTISITVTPVNDAPVAIARSLSTSEDTPLPVTLTGSDVDEDSLSFAISTQPAHGTLTGTPPDLTYTPAPDYRGPDSFTFTASDGTTTSAPGTLSI
ncbi:MAG: tandem-95 repeat protein, partial [Myxococcaceae bacterium]|nr:tandem-95 repeat protein [Myxococcaceae bacterium]